MAAKKTTTTKKTNGCFNKQGVWVEVSVPTTADGKPAPYTGTVAGGLHQSVGFVGKYKKK